MEIQHPTFKSPSSRLEPSTLPSNLGGLCVNAECVYFKVGKKNNGKLFKLLQSLVCQHDKGVSNESVTSSNTARRNLRKRPPPNSAERHRRRKWWRFCRDDDDDGNRMHRGSGDCRRWSSLGEYLEVERRSGDEAVYGSAEVELEGAVAERALFADGRVLPPASAEVVSGEGTLAITALCRFPVSLTGICSGGGG